MEWAATWPFPACQLLLVAATPRPADNKRSKCFTVLEVEVADYPGLLRVVSWVLNGLDVVAQNAVVSGIAAGPACPAVVILPTRACSCAGCSWAVAGTAVQLLGSCTEKPEHHACLNLVAPLQVRTSPDGQAHNTFWLTNRSGGAARHITPGPCPAGAASLRSCMPAHVAPWPAPVPARAPRCNTPAARPRTPQPLALAGEKLSDAASELLAERVRDFVM